MKVILPFPAQRDAFISHVKEMHSWQLIMPSETSVARDLCGHDIWLGSSRTERIWALAVVPVRNNYEKFQAERSTVAILFDPPKRQPEVIAEILLRAYMTEDTIDQITRCVPFRTYQQMRHYFPDAPIAWSGIPAELAIRLNLSDGAGVNASTFQKFERDSITEALRVVYGRRHSGLLIHYSLVACEVIPLLEWDIDWPLARRGKETPVRRGKVQGTFPWEYTTDSSLLTLYQYLPPKGTIRAPTYYGEPIVRLRVGGRSRNEAISNWGTCANALRKLKREIVAAGYI